MALRVMFVEKKPVGDAFTQLYAIAGYRRDGTLWKCDVHEAIDCIETGKETFYVDVDGAKPNLMVGVHDGIKYLTTYLDRGQPASLLALPEIPSGQGPRAIAA
jgi:hypothetical protein